jgi:bifunctional non-homologous end joining protein LigD
VAGLRDYQRKRDFARTPEPRGRARTAPRSRRVAARETAPAPLQFVVQQHAARRMHWDFRLELGGVLKSWAVPKGPSLVAGERRMAVQTEDHPLQYADFEGVIPKGEYGGGTVVVWDRGFWTPIGDPVRGLARGKLDFELAGEKLRGRWHLVRMKSRERNRASWLLIKGRDAQARPSGDAPVVESETRSVLTGRGLDEVAREETGAAPARRRRGGKAASAPGDPAALTGARRAAFPRSAQLQLATLVDAAPDGPEWLHEIKLDGYRILCRLERGAVRLVTRNGLDWTERFAELARELARLPARSALLDGEAVVFDRSGRTQFQLLQGALGRKASADRVHFVVFDCLYLDGVDVRAAPLLERKQLVRALLARLKEDARVRQSEHVVGRGREFHAAACARGVEGTVAKRIDAPYRSGRSRAWLKVRCSKRQEFVIAGFTDPAGSRHRLGALLLGAHDASGALRYCGKVGTGFDTETLGSLHAALARIERKRSALEDPPRMRGVHWVAPKLVAEVSFTEWTAEGRVRHPVFLGLREDKSAAEVRIEGEQPAETAEQRDTIAGVALTNPGRIYFPKVGITKRDLAAYYEAVAERALPGLVGRPLTLVRCPQGVGGACFYQKHAGDGIPDAVGRVRVRGGEAPYAMVNDLTGLVSLVQLGVLEFHVWGARADRLDRPDLIVFDIDPDPAVPWKQVIETATLLRGHLEDLGLAAFARVTGGKGVHVVSPLVRRPDWDEVRGFAKGVAQKLARLAPDRFTAVMSKASRKGKIYLDWVRNTREATAVASYSVRARPEAPVALPIAWDELESLSAPLYESVRDAPRRMNAPDPWADFEAARRPLTRAAIASVRR